MSITLSLATADDAEAIAALRTAVGADLTARFGTGHWTQSGSVKTVMSDIATANPRFSRLLVARANGAVIATVRLQTKKPWAIDTDYFTPCERPLYLTSMAVDPSVQRSGVGRDCLIDAARLARDWPADAIRLDAYDADAGAAGFYEKCGFREVGRVSYKGTPLVYLEQIL
jgi:ribosomal protein S18 acetylase RimI-like enzyme